jgi:hypothetical protein
MSDYFNFGALNKYIAPLGKKKKKEGGPLSFPLPDNRTVNPPKPKRKTISEKTIGGHPNTVKGREAFENLAIQGLKEGKQYKVPCTGQEQCAGAVNTYTKNKKQDYYSKLGIKDKHGNPKVASKVKRNAWSELTPDKFNILYTNPSYKDQMDVRRTKGNTKPLDYIKSFMPKEIFTRNPDGTDPYEGKVGVFDRKNDGKPGSTGNNSYGYAKENKGKNEGGEHVGVFGALIAHPYKKNSDGTPQMGRFVDHQFSGKEGGKEGMQAYNFQDWVSETDGLGFKEGQNKYSLVSIYEDKELAGLEQAYKDKLKEDEFRKQPFMKYAPYSKNKMSMKDKNKSINQSFKSSKMRFGGMIPQFQTGGMTGWPPPGFGPASMYFMQGLENYDPQTRSDAQKAYEYNKWKPGKYTDPNINKIPESELFRKGYELKAEEQEERGDAIQNMLDLQGSLKNATIDYSPVKDFWTAKDYQFDHDYGSYPGYDKSGKPLQTIKGTDIDSQIYGGDMFFQGAPFSNILNNKIYQAPKKSPSYISQNATSFEEDIPFDSDGKPQKIDYAGPPEYDYSDKPEVKGILPSIIDISTLGTDTDDPDDPKSDTQKAYENLGKETYKTKGKDNAQLYHSLMLGADIGMLINNLRQQPPPRQDFSRTGLSRVDVDLTPYDLQRSKFQEIANRSFRKGRESLGQASDMMKMTQGLAVKGQEALRDVGSAESQAINKERLANIDISNKEQMINDQQRDKEMQTNYNLMAQFYNQRSDAISKSIGAIKQDLRNMADYDIKKDYIDRTERLSREQAKRQDAISAIVALKDLAPSLENDPLYKKQVSEKQTAILGDITEELNRTHGMNKPDEIALKNKKADYATSLGQYEKEKEAFGDAPDKSKYYTDEPQLEDFTDDEFPVIELTEEEIDKGILPSEPAVMETAQQKYDAAKLEFDTAGKSYKDDLKAYEDKKKALQDEEVNLNSIKAKIDAEEAYMNDYKRLQKEKGYDNISKEIKKELGIPSRTELTKQIIEIIKDQSVYDI